MQYNGGKRAVGEEWAKLIAPRGCLVYWEPFCGMLGVGRHVNATRRIFSDLDSSVIHYLKALQSGWIPPASLSEEEYRKLKNEGNCYDPLYAFAAYGCSFAGKRWGGFARSASRDYARNAHRSSLELQQLIRETDRFQTSSYLRSNVKLHSQLIVYCDPPYKDTTGAGVSWSFSSSQFVDWCNRTAPHVQSLYVSEFKPLAPNWIEIHSTDVTDGLKATRERLFRVISPE